MNATFGSGGSGGFAGDTGDYMFAGAYGGGGGSARGVYYFWDPEGDPGGSEVIQFGQMTGGRGAVRIIWGAGRSYPSNAANV